MRALLVGMVGCGIASAAFGWRGTAGFLLGLAAAYVLVEVRS